MTNLCSERLRIEPIRSAHAELVFSALQNQTIYTYLPDDPPTAADLEKRYDYWEKGCSPDGSERWLNWVAFQRDTGTPVGTFQATLPMGRAGSFAYVVFPSFWKRGYGREMATCILTHLFDTHPMPSLYAEIDTRNLGSIRLVESLGMKRIKTTHAADFFKGASSDEYTYSVSREDWLASQSERD